jgi:hypothetical protein
MALTGEQINLRKWDAMRRAHKPRIVAWFREEIASQFGNCNFGLNAPIEYFDFAAIHLEKMQVSTY